MQVHIREEFLRAPDHLKLLAVETELEPGRHTAHEVMEVPALFQVLLPVPDVVLCARLGDTQTEPRGEVPFAGIVRLNRGPLQLRRILLRLRYTISHGSTRVVTSHDDPAPPSAGRAPRERRVVDCDAEMRPS